MAHVQIEKVAWKSIRPRSSLNIECSFRRNDFFLRKNSEPIRLNETWCVYVAAGSLIILSALARFLMLLFAFVRFCVCVHCLSALIFHCFGFNWKLFFVLFVIHSVGVCVELSITISLLVRMLSEWKQKSARLISSIWIQRIAFLSHVSAYNRGPFKEFHVQTHEWEEQKESAEKESQCRCCPFGIFTFVWKKNCHNAITLYAVSICI